MKALTVIRVEVNSEAIRAINDLSITLATVLRYLIENRVVPPASKATAPAKVQPKHRKRVYVKRDMGYWGKKKAA